MSPTVTKKNGEGTAIPSLFSDFFNADRLFDFNFPSFLSASKLPAVNIREKDNGFLVDVAAPGLSKDDFKVKVENNVLTISAEKEVSSEEKTDKFTRQEYSFNTFSRSFTLPESVNINEISAKYEDGVLKLVIPKKEEAKKDNGKEIRISLKN